MEATDSENMESQEDTVANHVRKYSPMGNTHNTKKTNPQSKETMTRWQRVTRRANDKCVACRGIS